MHDQLDLPSETWDALAVLAMAFGTVMAARGKSFLRLTILACGFFTGIVLTAMLLSLIEDGEEGENFSMNSNLWLSLCILGGVLLCAAVDHVLALSKVVVSLTLGLCLAGVFNQYVVENLPDNNGETGSRNKEGIDLLVLFAFMCVGFALAYRAFDLALVYCTAIGGGVCVLLGLSRLMRGPITPEGMWGIMDSSKVECEDWTCWGPLLAGTLVALAGIAHQLAYCKRTAEQNAAMERQQPLLFV